MSRLGDSPGYCRSFRKLESSPERLIDNPGSLYNAKFANGELLKSLTAD